MAVVVGLVVVNRDETFVERKLVADNLAAFGLAVLVFHRCGPLLHVSHARTLCDLPLCLSLPTHR